MKIILDNIQTNLVVTGHDDLAYPGIFYDLRKYMSVPVPGAYFSPQYKKKQWDGIRYFITPTGRMATGFLPVLAKHLDDDYPDLKIEVVDKRGDIPEFKSNMITKIGSVIAEGDYEHQKHAIASLDYYFAIRESQIAFPRGILNAATNAGKMAIIAGSYLNLEGDNRMLVTIHNKTLFKQLVEAFEDIFDGDVGIINDKNYKPNVITVAMIKTLYNRIQSSNNVKKDMRMFNVVAVDECHLAGSKTYQGVLKAVPAPVRIFVSGTPFDSDAIVNKMIAIGLSGPERYSISKRELMDKGVSLECKIHMHLCYEPNPAPYVKQEGDQSKMFYDHTIEEMIIRSARRMALMQEIIEAYPGSTLIAVKFVEHGHLISASLQLLGNKSITFVHGSDPEREQKIQDFADGKINTLVSTRILREGANIPIIKNVINAMGGKAKGELKQWMGRGERLFGDMKEFNMHDFYDVGMYVEKHSRSRIAAYKKEQLEITEHYTKKIIQNIHLSC